MFGAAVAAAPDDTAAPAAGNCHIHAAPELRRTMAVAMSTQANKMQMPGEK
jgi:hypothetical protein